MLLPAATLDLYCYWALSMLYIFCLKFDVLNSVAVSQISQIFSPHPSYIGVDHLIRLIPEPIPLSYFIPLSKRTKSPLPPFFVLPLLPSLRRRPSSRDPPRNSLGTLASAEAVVASQPLTQKIKMKKLWIGRFRTVDPCIALS